MQKLVLLMIALGAGIVTEDGRYLLIAIVAPQGAPMFRWQEPQHHIATANGTATAGSDYTATSGTLTFSPGVTTRTLTVPVLGEKACCIASNCPVLYKLSRKGAVVR